MGWQSIYFLSLPSDDDKVKIGRAKDPFDRLNSHSSGNWEKPYFRDIVYFAVGPDRTDELDPTVHHWNIKPLLLGQPLDRIRDIEGDLHRMFYKTAFHLKNEWYVGADEVVQRGKDMLKRKYQDIMIPFAKAKKLARARREELNLSFQVSHRERAEIAEKKGRWIEKMDWKFELPDRHTHFP